MKNIEAVIPRLNLNQTIQQLHGLQIQDIVVEPVQVFHKNLHRPMIHRGCKYEENFTTESKIRFSVPEVEATQAEAILVEAGALS